MNKIMTCIDGSNISFTVSDYAAWAKNKLNAPVELLHVLDKEQYPTEQNLSGSIGLGSREQLLDELVKLDEQRYKIALEQGRLILEDTQRYMLTKGIYDLEIRQRHGSLVETLAELEKEYQLVILGRQGEQTQSTYQHIGSQLETVIRTITKPILVTPSYYIEPTNLMLAYDGSIQSDKCVSMLLNNPLFKSLPIHLVTVGLSLENKLLTAKTKLEQHKFKVQTAILSGEVDLKLNQYQKQQEISMLLIGSYAHTRL